MPEGRALSSNPCLTGSTPAASYEEEELPPDPSEETLTIEARFQPLLPESMTKSKDGFLGVSWVRGSPTDRSAHGRIMCMHSPPKKGSALSSSFLLSVPPPCISCPPCGPRGCRSGDGAAPAVQAHSLGREAAERGLSLQTGRGIWAGFLEGVRRL